MLKYKLNLLISETDDTLRKIFSLSQNITLYNNKYSYSTLPDLPITKQ